MNAYFSSACASFIILKECKSVAYGYANFSGPNKLSLGTYICVIICSHQKSLVKST